MAALASQTNQSAWGTLIGVDDSITRPPVKIIIIFSSFINLD